jgi:chromosome segregation ATPase
VVARRRTPSTLHHRLESLLAALAETEAESARLRSEAEYLVGQVRQAQEQVRHYEGLLTELRRDWGRAPRLTELVRRLG